MRVAISWSGGKDSCLATWYARRQGLDVVFLLNAMYGQLHRVSFHGTRARHIVRQAEAMDLRLLQFPVPLDLAQYEAAFKRAVSKLQRIGVEGIVFGDIYLDEHRQWGERVASEIGVTPYWPLWGRDTHELLPEFIDAGFEAVVVAANVQYFREEWLGRRTDAQFQADIEQLAGERGVDVCGERGEYHTLVIDGPLFRRRLAVTYGPRVQKDGYWMLDLPRGRLQPKRS